MCVCVCVCVCLSVCLSVTLCRAVAFHDHCLCVRLPGSSLLPCLSCLSCLSATPSVCMYVCVHGLDNTRVLIIGSFIRTIGQSDDWLIGRSVRQSFGRSVLRSDSLNIAHLMKTRFP